MIAFTCRAFFRTPKAWQLTNSYVIGSRANHLQGYQSYRGLSYISKPSVAKGTLGSMGWNRKRKTGTPVWRQISTQSESSHECVGVDMVGGPANMAGAEQGEQNDIVSIVRGVADSSISSSSLPAKERVDEAEGMLVRPVSTSQHDGLKDAEDFSGDATSPCAAQSIGGLNDADNLTETLTEKHAKSLEVGAPVMRFIKGKDGSTQKSIEAMGVKVIFPSSKTEDWIILEGSSEEVITQASWKIQTIIDEVVNSSSFAYSHFISLPLAMHPELVDKATKFQLAILGSDSNDVRGTKDENLGDDGEEDEDKVDQSDKESGVAINIITEDKPSYVEVDIKNIPAVSYAPKAPKPPTLDDLRIDESLFLKPQRLHLTVLMLKLWNKERLHAAMEVLQSVSSEVNEVLDGRPLFVTLKGLDLMRGSQAKAQVLYACVEELGNEGRLTRACQTIIDAYVKAGLVLERDAHHKLKLHATLMNTSFRRGKRSYKKSKQQDHFDARGIFKQFGSELWGDYHLREAHLSQRFVYDDNGYYHCCASIPLPEISEVNESGASDAESVKMPLAESV